MKPLTRALAIAAIHVAIVSSLGAKLFYDRSTRPHVWIRTTNYDPNLPIRGRYVALRAVFDDPEHPSDPRKAPSLLYGRLELSSGRLAVRPVHYDEPNAQRFWRRIVDDSHTELSLEDPLLYFIADTAADPTRLKPGEELWVDATIPKAGPPRPIRLGIMRNGNLTPLDLR